MANDRSATATKTAPSLTFGKTEREDHPWEIQLVKHQERTESAEFRAAKRVDPDSEFQVDFIQNGASYSTPVLRLQ